MYTLYGLEGVSSVIVYTMVLHLLDIKTPGLCWSVPKFFTEDYNWLPFTCGSLLKISKQT
jgi:hypothetical protein